MEILMNIFLHGIAPEGNRLLQVLQNGFIMLCFCTVLAYLLNLLGLAFIPLYRTKRTKELVDTDHRVELFTGWALLIVSALMVVLIATIWYNNWSPSGAHLLVLAVLLGLLWLPVNLGLKRQVRRAHNSIQKL